MKNSNITRNLRKKRQKVSDLKNCHCCEKEFPFYWHCRCNFTICQKCMLENEWGMTCNGITWQCPDCGSHNGLGNQ